MENNTTNTTPATTTTTTSKPSNSTVSTTVLLLMRVLTSLFLLIALILIVITKETLDDDDDIYDHRDQPKIKIKFQDIHAYRYMISTIVIGFVYTLLQMALSIFTVATGNRVLNGDGGYKFDFYGDKIISYFLLSGSAAGFGASEDLQRLSDEIFDLPLISFFGKANASASLLLFGFIATAVASVFTSFALPKKAK
ncbi:CASP-like protein 4D1 [Trifolium pratense]|uniref:CASP-like protein 4D1 n=1 Tax=Trifolium pratense TaxID=57577 RepID=UPI001E6911B5|nr:CASP-like protein 4D1 [Trifolium pratense]